MAPFPLHPVQQNILLVLSSKCIQNLISQRFHCYLQPSLPAQQTCCLHTSQEVRNICLLCWLIISLSPSSAQKEFKKCLLHEMIHFVQKLQPEHRLGYGYLSFCHTQPSRLSVPGAPHSSTSHASLRPNQRAEEVSLLPWPLLPILSLSFFLAQEGPSTMTR